MIFFEGHSQKYRVEELSVQQAHSLLAQQMIESDEESDLRMSVREFLKRNYSFRTHLDK